MEEGPFRMQSSPDRRGVSRPTAAPRAPEQPQQPVATQQPPKVVQSSQPANKKGSNGLKVALILVGVAILAVAGWLFWSSTQNSGTAIESDKYQAVFFSNGNVYFGNLENVNSEYYKMTGVYYPQTQTDVEGDAAATQQPANQSSITLLKLGDAIHGPDDEMMIAKDQVLFYQNLRADSKVSQLINGQK